MIKKLSIGLVFTLLTIISCSHEPVVSDHKIFHVTILHTNDTHGRVWPTKGIDGVTRGGFAAQSALIKKIRSEVESEGGILLLLSAGDVNTGVPESDLLNAEPDFMSMNAMKYDAMVLGNHEFDGGVEKIFRQMKWARFPILSANILFREPQIKELAKPFVILEKKGIKFGILGLTTDDLRRLVIPKTTENLEIKNPVEIAKLFVPKMYAKGGDVLIAVTHIGVSHTGRREGVAIPNDDIRLAEEVPEIPIIIGGHSHTLLSEGIKVNNTLVTQAGEKGENLGRVDFDWDSVDRKVINAKAKVIPISPEKGEDPEVKALNDKYLKKIARIFDRVVGVTNNDLVGERGRSRHFETNLGNFICDVIRKYAKADVAVFNGGGIRASIPKGKIQLRHIYQAFPFKNTVATATVTGKLLQEIILTGVRNRNQTGSLLQVSGMSYTYKGDQVESILIGGVPLNLSQKYKLATNNFVMTGGDGFDVFKQAENIKDTSRPIEELLIQHLKTQASFNIIEEGRIKSID